jgi:hypothetical protein
MTNCLFFVNRYYPILRAIAFTRFTFFPPDEQAACDRWIDFNSYSVMVNVATGERKFPHFLIAYRLLTTRDSADVSHRVHPRSKFVLLIETI